jgi:hypothetical protein
MVVTSALATIFTLLLCRQVRTPEGKRPLRRPMRRLEDNIGMDFREIGCRLDGSG